MAKLTTLIQPPKYPTYQNVKHNTNIKNSTMTKVTQLQTNSKRSLVTLTHLRKKASASLPALVMASKMSSHRSFGGKPCKIKFWGSVQRETSTYTWPSAKTPSKLPATICLILNAWLQLTVFYKNTHPSIYTRSASIIDLPASCGS